MDNFMTQAEREIEVNKLYDIQMKYRHCKRLPIDEDEIFFIDEKKAVIK